MELMIGTDPEVFLRDSTGKYFSALEKGMALIPGTKLRPHPVPKGAIQIDGVALEFNTAPAKTKEEFTGNIAEVLKSLETEFKKLRPELEIVMTPTATFDKEYFDKLPMEATILGCTPDYNAYTGEENEPPGTDEPFRTGSGHIHVGWSRWENPHDEDFFKMCRDIVKQLDCVLYPASLLWDDDDKRRTLYGKIGAFRPKPYGLEYRPLSNAYLRDVKTQEYVFDVTMKAVKDFFGSVFYFQDDYALDIVVDIRAGRDVMSDGYVEEHLQYMNEKYGVPVYG